MLLDRSTLLQNHKPKTEIISLSDGEVQICELGAVEYLRLWTTPEFNDSNGDTDMLKFIPALMVRCITDFEGNRLFSDSDADLIGGLDKDAFMILSTAAKKMNGLNGDEIKNSEAGQTISSSIDCACNSDSDTLTSSLQDSQPVS